MPTCLSRLITRLQSPRPPPSLQLRVFHQRPEEASVANSRQPHAPSSPSLQLRVFHQHPEGVVSVKFTALEPADECVKRMNGRFFGGRQLVAHKWDGYTNFNIKVRFPLV